MHTTCTDDDLARALDYARGLHRAAPAHEKLLARALLRLEAELAAMDAALRGKPVPPGASERARRVAGLCREVACAHVTSPIDAEVDAFWCGVRDFWRGAPGTAEDALRAYPIDMVRRVAWRTGWLVAEKWSKVEPAPEDDGLTAEDRAAGWRWELHGRTHHLYVGTHKPSVAIVTAAGWAHGPLGDAGEGDGGPETGAAGQRAAVAHLRAAGVL